MKRNKITFRAISFFQGTYAPLWIIPLLIATHALAGYSGGITSLNKSVTIEKCLIGSFENEAAQKVYYFDLLKSGDIGKSITCEEFVSNDRDFAFRDYAEGFIISGLKDYLFVGIGGPAETNEVPTVCALYRPDINNFTSSNHVILNRLSTKNQLERYGQITEWDFLKRLEAVLSANKAYANADYLSSIIPAAMYIYHWRQANYSYVLPFGKLDALSDLFFIYDDYDLLEKAEGYQELGEESTYFISYTKMAIRFLPRGEAVTPSDEKDTYYQSFYTWGGASNVVHYWIFKTNAEEGVQIKDIPLGVL